MKTERVPSYAVSATTSVLRNDVSELRIDVGPGYRLYYATDRNRIVLLLCGGDKSTQRPDTDRACGYWQEWNDREEDPSDAS